MIAAFLQKPSPLAPALIYNGISYSYGDILSSYKKFCAMDLPQKSTVLIAPEFTAESVGFFFALLEKGNAVILCNETRFASVHVQEWEKRESLVKVREKFAHPLLDSLFQQNKCGLAFLTSGSTGLPKIVLHDFSKILSVFADGKKSRTTYAFLPFEQIGGFYNLLYVLTGGGTLVSDSQKTPHRVAESMARSKVQFLSCNPSFLRLFYMSRAWEQFDLSHLEQINFGTEPMPQSTLKLLQAALPNVKLRQKFGMSEIGVVGAKVEAEDSPYIQIDPKYCESRVVDGMLELRPKTLMLGYIQGEASDAQFTPDGWLKTGDMVLVKGPYMQILGRYKDLISVGGRKVMPQEVEEALQDMPGVLDILVEGEENVLLGQVVRAKVVLQEKESHEQFRIRLRAHAKEKKLEEYKIPQRLEILEKSQWTAQMKKQRGSSGKIE